MRTPRQGTIETLLEGVPFHTGAQSYILTCPRCNKRNKLYISKSSGRFVCWTCRETSGFEGRPEFALTEILQRPIREIQEVLYGEVAETVNLQHLHTELIDPWVREESPPEPEEVKPVVYPVDFYPIDHPLAVQGARYLAGRGVNLELATSYGIQYWAPKRRVIFPASYRGTLYGWQARTIDRDSWVDEATGKRISIPKALTSEGLKRDRILMFRDRLDGSKHCVLTEGPMDALKCHLVGGNVCTLGKSVSEAQVQLIRESGVERVYLGLDPDAAGEVRRLARELGNLDLYLLRPSGDVKDLGDMTLAAVLEAFKTAERVKMSRLVTYFKTPRY